MICAVIFDIGQAETIRTTATANQLEVLARAVGAGTGAEINRLENIGLTLGIFTYEKILFIRKRDVQFFVIAKIFQLQAFRTQIAFRPQRLNGRRR